MQRFVRRLGALLALVMVSGAAMAACTVDPAVQSVPSGHVITISATCEGLGDSTATWKRGVDVVANSSITNLSSKVTLVTVVPTVTTDTTYVYTLNVGNVTVDPVATANVYVSAGATLTITKNGAGTVTSAPAGIDCGSECAEPYAAGTQVRLYATPTSNSVFSSWSGDCVGTGECVVTMQGVRNVTAIFAASANGVCGSADSTIAVSSQPTSGLCSPDSQVPVTAGSASYTWQCPGVGQGSPASCSVPRQYTVTASSGGNGTIAPTSHNVPAGQSHTLTVTPDQGYSVASVSGCGGSLSGNTYTTGAISAACAVTATFSNAPVNGACGSAHGTTPVKATPTNLCSVGSASNVAENVANYTWTCQGANNGTTASCSVPRAYTVSVSAGSNGSVSPASKDVVGNTTTTFTATPSTGYMASSVSGTCGGSVSGTTYTTGQIAADCSATVNFTQYVASSTDPGRMTGLWIPPGVTDLVVADQSGTNGQGAYTYMPGCLNQTIPTTAFSGCAMNSTFTGPLPGGGSHTVTMSAGQTLSLRFRSLGTAPSGTKNFRLNGPDGGNLGRTVSMWLSLTPGGTALTGPYCSSITSSAANIYTSSSTSLCQISPNTDYYLNVKSVDSCEGCRFILTENPDFY